MALETLSLKQLPSCATVPSVTHLDAIVSAVLCQQEIADGTDYREDTLVSCLPSKHKTTHIRHWIETNTDVITKRNMYGFKTRGVKPS
jgi:hypothetical protein